MFLSISQRNQKSKIKNFQFLSKKNNYIAILEVKESRHIYLFKSVNIDGVMRQIKRKNKDAVVISVYPEPRLL